jgi:hypothetical protein
MQAIRSQASALSMGSSKPLGKQHEAFGRIRALDYLHPPGAEFGKCELALRRVDSLIQMQQMPVQGQKPTDKSDLKLVLK